MTQQKIAFVSDFDGTISDDDFFAYTTKAYFDERALAPWRAFLAGQKTHFDALKEMFSQIHVSADELRMLIDSIRIDPDLEAVWQVCKEKGIRLYVCSAGNDYYIRHLIGTLMEKFNVTLVSNKGEYSAKTGLIMTAPDKGNPYFDEKIGISKLKLVQKLKEDGFFVVFSGDGPPDIAPAEIADVVFAKKFLLKACREKGIETQQFEGFKDLLIYFKEL